MGCEGMQDPTDVTLTLPEVVAALVALAFCGAYVATKHWYLNNALGLAFSLQGIEHFSLGAVQTGIILLSGLFFYDIFWVFCTPVMVRASPKQGCLACCVLRVVFKGSSPSWCC